MASEMTAFDSIRGPYVLADLALYHALMAAWVAHRPIAPRRVQRHGDPGLSFSKSRHIGPSEPCGPRGTWSKSETPRLSCTMTSPSRMADRQFRLAAALTIPE
jgi:hypothetical protein